MTNIITFSEYPLIQDKLGELRWKELSTARFKQLMHEITLLMLNKVTFFLPTTDDYVDTPIKDDVKISRISMIAPPVIIPILRAGLGMVDAFKSMLPEYNYGSIKLKRDEHTKLPKKYYSAIPKIPKGGQVFIIDPMLATGGSARVAAYEVCKFCNHNDFYTNFVGIVASPLGVASLQESKLYDSVYIANIDEGLNDDAYIVPGLGDAGDRLFGKSGKSSRDNA